MTLGLPPAGTFWQPAGGSPSPNSLPSPLRSFVPGPCSAHLGAVRVRREEGRYRRSCLRPQPPAPSPSFSHPPPRPSPTPSSPSGRDQALRLLGPGHPLSLVPCGDSGAQKHYLFCLPRANPSPAPRIPRTTAETPAERPGFLLGGLSSPE